MASCLKIGTKTPPIAQGVTNFGSVYNVELTQRAEQRFPNGSALSDVISALTAQGFVISPDNKTATFSDGDIVCNLKWWFVWELEDNAISGIQRIHSIEGNNSAVCV